MGVAGVGAGLTLIGVAAINAVSLVAAVAMTHETPKGVFTGGECIAVVGPVCAFVNIFTPDAVFSALFTVKPVSGVTLFAGTGVTPGGVGAVQAGHAIV